MTEPDPVVESVDLAARDPDASVSGPCPEGISWLRQSDALPEPALYVGHVVHHRLAPLRHRFAYRVIHLLLDIDRLADLDRRLRLLSLERPNLYSVRCADHGPRDGTPLRPWVERQLADHGMAIGRGRVFLLCMPRVLGYVFNPLSIYYCYDDGSRLMALIYEVRNTFGEQHAYVVGAAPGQRPSGTVRHRFAKAFYVSPFIEPRAHYALRITPPGPRLSVAIWEQGEAGTRLFASLTGDRRPLTDRQLTWAAFSHPLVTLKVIAGIHWEALRLWRKGAPRVPRSTARRPARCR